jgi:hypothetical protein
VFHTALSRAGPGLLLRDIVAGDDPQVRATLRIIAAAEADVLLLLDMDFDAGPCRPDRPGRGARRAMRDAPYPHRFAAPPNTGRPTGVDLDGDGRSWRARDAHGYGLFSGDGGMAILSRVPIGRCATSRMLPWMALPESAAGAVTPPEALETLRLHRRGLGRGGSDTRRPDPHPRQPRLAPGLRRAGGSQRAAQRDELRFWALYLDGWSPEGPPFAADRFA